MKSFGLKETLVPTLSLFASTGTLLCCALPALMVSLGMGAALAGLVNDFPALVWLSRHKISVFAVSAMLIAFAGVMMLQANRLPCPADPAQAKACANLRRFSWAIWGSSVLCFSAGFFFAFIAPAVMVK